jgi:hypothetical protein
VGAVVQRVVEGAAAQGHEGRGGVQEVGRRSSRVGAGGTGLGGSGQVWVEGRR